MIRYRWPLLTAAEMRELDRVTIEERGIPGELLMEVAGQLVARRAEALVKREAAVRVVCGAGNNAGDGWVAARHLQLRGTAVEVIETTPSARLSGDAASARARALAVGVRVTRELAVQRGDLVVDALFGTGLSRPVEGQAASWIEAIRRSRPDARVLAVDLPSGLNADTGQVMGTAVQADETLTLGLPKLGLVFEPGRTLAGRIRVARIGIADPEPGSARAELWTRAAAAAALPARSPAGHKGSFGHVLVIAGSEGMTGAAALAARGAGRSGAGLVTVACPESTNPALEALVAEAMTVPVAETAQHGLAPAAAKRLLELAEGRSAVVLGPGIGRDPETAALVRELVPAIAKPLVLDADGLHALAEAPAMLKARKAATIVTPHPGEAAFLLGGTPAEILADRPAAARALAAATGAIVILKGAGTVIAEPVGAAGPPEARLAVNPTGGPALGTGGTGDVLAGITGALLGQGVPAYEAAVLAAFVHGAAGDRLAASRGDAGVLAGDVAEALPETLAALRAAGGGAEMQGDVLAFPEP